MPTPFESAQLNLKLYELRREPVLREARAWFTGEFNPETFDELRSLISGKRNPSFRMVVGYWDMAASLVTSGAIDSASFLAAHGEIFGAFCKIQPFLAEMRASMGEQEFCKHLETVMMAAPDAEKILTRRRERLRALAKARAAAQQTQSAG